MHAMLFFSKHPRDLTSEALQKSNTYQNHKIQIGEPIESEIIDRQTQPTFYARFSLPHILQGFSSQCTGT
jgi:hypothetical protein